MTSADLTRNILPGTINIEQTLFDALIVDCFRETVDGAAGSIFSFLVVGVVSARRCYRHDAASINKLIMKHLWIRTITRRRHYHNSSNKEKPQFTHFEASTPNKTESKTMIAREHCRILARATIQMIPAGISQPTKRLLADVAPETVSSSTKRLLADVATKRLLADVAPETVSSSPRWCQGARSVTDQRRRDRGA
jgi:hypothetical protein